VVPGSCRARILQIAPDVMPAAPEPRSIARHTDPPEPTTELVREALEATRDLVRIEIALAREEIGRQVAAAKRGAVAFAVAAVAAIVALSMILAALALAMPSAAVAAALIAAVLFAVAVTLGALGWRSLPKKPLARTQSRLENDVKKVKERIA
jgi:urease accessory protein UreF